MAKLALTKEDQYRIYNYFVGSAFELGIAYLSPIPVEVRGKKDRSSSFNIYETRFGNLRWKDFGGGGELAGDAIDFIIHMVLDIYMLPDKQKFRAAVNFYTESINRNKLLTNQIILNQASKHSIGKLRKVTPIPSYDQEFTNSELLYWDGRPLYISKSHLICRRLYALRGIDWGEGVTFPSTDKDPAFIYDLSEKGDMSSWKAYRPLTKDKRFKWKSWNLNIIPFEGYHLLPGYGESLILTSSGKDGMVAENLGFTCGNPTGESAFRSILPYQRELNRRFKNIYICFDGDSAGIKGAKNLAALTGWKIIFIEYPKFTGKRMAAVKRWNLKHPDIIRSEFTKDLAEIVENYNYAELDYLLKINMAA